jgi:transposase
VLVNLETSEVVDVLVGREAKTLAGWLQAHTGVDVISRDRAESYAEGGRQGAPQAIQVADRWHLLKNLGDMLVRVLSHHHRELNHAGSPPVETNVAFPLRDKVDTNSPRNLRFLKVHKLKEKSFHVSAIAKQIGLDRITVRKYLSLTTLTDAPRLGSNKLNPYWSTDSKAGESRKSRVWIESGAPTGSGHPWRQLICSRRDLAQA